MGGCVGTTRRRRDGSGSRRPSAFSDSISDPDSVSTKNRPLRHDRVCQTQSLNWERGHVSRVTFGKLYSSFTFQTTLPLYLFQIRWKSDIPLTEGQLKSKRDEFWDTAPAFEGKSEIWNALKAAVEAIEVNDYDLAQG